MQDVRGVCPREGTLSSPNPVIPQRGESGSSTLPNPGLQAKASDLQHGRRIERLTIENPFLGG